MEPRRLTVLPHSLGITSTIVFPPSLRWQICATIVSTMVHAARYGNTPTAVCWAYCLLGMTVAYWLMRPLVPLVYRCNKLEGDFRLTHSRVREFSECIAMYDGELAEKRVSGRAFASLYEVRVPVGPTIVFCRLHRCEVVSPPPPPPPPPQSSPRVLAAGIMSKLNYQFRRVRVDNSPWLVLP